MFTELKSRLERHKGTLLFTCSNVVLAAATFLGSFVCARLLAPDQLGAFQTALLLVTYLGFLPLGVFNGFNRQYPYLLGRREPEAAALLARTGYSVARVTAAIAAILAIGQFLFFWKTSGDPALILAAVAVIPVAALSQINALQSAILTGRQLFGLDRPGPIPARVLHARAPAVGLEVHGAGTVRSSGRGCRVRVDPVPVQDGRR